MYNQTRNLGIASLAAASTLYYARDPVDSLHPSLILPQFLHVRRRTLIRKEMPGLSKVARLRVPYINFNYYLAGSWSFEMQLRLGALREGRKHKSRISDQIVALLNVPIYGGDELIGEDEEFWEVIDGLDIALDKWLSTSNQLSEQ